LDAAGDEQGAERTLDGVTQPVHRCLRCSADAEHFGQLETVQLVPVGEVEDGLVTLGQSTAAAATGRRAHFVRRVSVRLLSLLVRSMSVGSRAALSLVCSASFLRSSRPGPQFVCIAQLSHFVAAVQNAS